MRVLIVENEAPASAMLRALIAKIDRSIVVTGVVESVEKAVVKLQEDPPPDLILMDIMLDDGLCFEIFETVMVDIPVIFTTAFDEYTLRAFKVNSVDYLLKPIGEEALRFALDKFTKLYSEQSPVRNDFQQLLREFRNHYKSRFLIKINDKFKSLPVKEIRYCYINNKSVFIRDFNGQDYGIDYSLEQLQDILDPVKFFRINRECIVNIDSISLMHSYSSSRLRLSLGDEAISDLFVVSREKVSEFKKWIDR